MGGLGPHESRLSNVYIEDRLVLTIPNHLGVGDVIGRMRATGLDVKNAVTQAQAKRRLWGGRKIATVQLGVEKGLFRSPMALSVASTAQFFFVGEPVTLDLRVQNLGIEHEIGRSQPRKESLYKGPIAIFESDETAIPQLSMADLKPAGTTRIDPAKKGPVDRLDAHRNATRAIGFGKAHTQRINLVRALGVDTVSPGVFRISLGIELTTGGAGGMFGRRQVTDPVTVRVVEFAPKQFQKQTAFAFEGVVAPGQLTIVTMGKYRIDDDKQYTLLVLSSKQNKASRIIRLHENLASEYRQWHAAFDKKNGKLHVTATAGGKTDAHYWVLYPKAAEIELRQLVKGGAAKRLIEDNQGSVRFAEP